MGPNRFAACPNAGLEVLRSAMIVSDEFFARE
jgi:hypothetical protein